MSSGSRWCIIASTSSVWRHIRCRLNFSLAVDGTYLLLTALLISRGPIIILWKIFVYFYSIETMRDVNAIKTKKGSANQMWYLVVYSFAYVVGEPKAVQRASVQSFTRFRNGSKAGPDPFFLRMLLCILTIKGCFDVKIILLFTYVLP